MVTRLQAPTVPWWLVLLEGIAAVVIGFLLLTAPAMTTLVLVQVLGIYWFVTGIFSIVSIFIDSSMWGWKLAAGILGIIAGIVVINHPLWSAVLVPTVLIIFLGIEGLVIGAINIFQAFRGGGWGIGVLGALSILFGIVLIANPLLAAVSLPLVLGILGLVLGIAAIVMAFRLR